MTCYFPMKCINNIETELRNTQKLLFKMTKDGHMTREEYTDIRKSLLQSQNDCRVIRRVINHYNLSKTYLD